MRVTGRQTDTPRYGIIDRYRYHYARCAFDAAQKQCWPVDMVRVIEGVTLRVKGKGNGHALDIAPLVKESHCRSAQVWHALSREFTVLPTHPHIYPRMEWIMPAFAFPAKAGRHSPTQEGLKAELA